MCARKLKITSSAATRLSQHVPSYTMPFKAKRVKLTVKEPAKGPTPQATQARTANRLDILYDDFANELMEPDSDSNSTASDSETAVEEHDELDEDNDPNNPCKRIIIPQGLSCQ